MEDGKSSPCLLVPMVKRRKVSAIRDFPKGLKQLSDVDDFKLRTSQACGSDNKYLEGTGLDQFRKECRIVDSKEKGVHESSSRRKVGVVVAEVIRDYPKGFKQIPEVLDPKLRQDESCGLENMKELKPIREQVDAKSKGDQPCRLKNAKELKGSSEELDPNVELDKTCRSNNESLKPIELHETYNEHEREVDSEQGVNQFGTEQQSGNGDKNKVSAAKKKPFYQNIGDISSSDVTNNGVKSWREEQKPDSEQDVDRRSCLERQCTSADGNVLMSKESLKCQDNDSSFNVCILTGVTDNMHRTLPKRRKVSAIRDYPPALVLITLSSGPSGKELPIDNIASTNHLGMLEGSSSNDKITIEPSYQINDVEIDGHSSPPDEPSLNMEKRESYHPGSHSSAVINDVQESACQLDTPDDLFHRAPIDTPNFFSDDNYNGFLFEDDV